MSIGRYSGEEDQPFITFQENVAGALDNKEYYLLKYSGNNKVALSAAAGDEIGISAGKVQNGTTQTDVSVKTLAEGLVRKVKAGGTIADGAWVIGNGDGTVITVPTGLIADENSVVNTGTFRTALGIAKCPGGAASGDVIAVLIQRTLLVKKAS